jgi:hypothetical protein
MRFSRREVEERLHLLARKKGMPQLTKDEARKALGKEPEIRTHCHAEIQLLLRLESPTSLKEYPVPYLGAARRHVGYVTSFCLGIRAGRQVKGISTRQGALMEKFIRCGT